MARHGLGLESVIRPRCCWKIDKPALQEDMARNVAFVEEQAKRLLAQQ